MLKSERALSVRYLVKILGRGTIIWGSGYCFEGLSLELPNLLMPNLNTICLFIVDVLLLPQGDFYLEGGALVLADGGSTWLPVNPKRRSIFPNFVR